MKRVSFSHRALEVAGIGLFAVAFVFLSSNALRVGLNISGEVSIGFIALLFVLSVMAADFFSGFVHFLCDNFGSAETPFLGPNFIKAFLDHHDHPQDMVAHDFVELLGNSCLGSIPLLVGLYYLLPLDGSTPSLYGNIFTLMLILVMVLTNQFHQWAHNPQSPKFVKKLQRLNLILSPENHNRHHKPPYDKNYCMTSGWLNPFLNRIRFFDIVAKFLGKSSSKS